MKKQIYNILRKNGSAVFNSSSVRHCSSVFRSPIGNVEYGKGNFYETIFKNISKYENRIALQCGATGQKLTYAQLYDRSAKWSGFLKKQQLQIGDRMGLILPNSPQYVCLYLGAARVGVCTSPIPAIFGKDEMLHQLKVTKPKLIVVWEPVRPVLEEAVKELDYIPKIISTDLMNPESEIENILKDKNIDFLNPEQLSGDEEMYVCFSGGTTGLPKGVSHCHNAFSLNTMQINHPHFFEHLKNNDDQDVTLGLLPFYHMAGLSVALNTKLEMGSKIVTLPKFEPESFMKTLKEEKMSIAIVVPSILDFMLQRDDVNKHTMPNLRTLMVGAAPVSQTSADKLVQKMDGKTSLQEGYGMTEIMISAIVPTSSYVIGTCGNLLPGMEGKIVDLETREPVPINSPGELLIKTSTLMKCYIGNEKATREAIEDGYIITGDVATVDENGYIRIVDRAKDIIKCRGHQVSPAEIEDICKKHDNVVAVSVIGVPHEAHGEVPKAFIVSKDKSKNNEEELISFTNSHLAKYKHVSSVEFVDTLPTSPVGKILKRKLRE